MPVFRNRSVIVAQGIKAFLSLELGITCGKVPKPKNSKSKAPRAPRVSGRSGVRSPKLEQAGRWLAERSQRLESRARGSLASAAAGGGAGGIRPENVVWIFGAGRTGSTWLSQMMGEIKGHAVWFEPWVGALFDPNHLRLEERKGKHFILSHRYRDTWLASIKSFVLDGAEARFPEATGDGHLVIKEPGGSAGAPLLMEALPESSMILLVRDPRDVVASWMDAHSEGGWKDGQDKDKKKNSGPTVRGRSRRYLKNVGEAKKAYDAHRGRKVLVRYEDLREDALGTMRRVYSTLGIEVDEGELKRAVEEHSWERIPEEEKGEGKFYRKASPGSWREDLTPDEIKTVERITAPLLNELYPS